MANYNPPVENFFKTDRPESCTASLSLRVTPSLKSNLKKIENWQEFARQTLEEAIAKKSA